MPRGIYDRTKTPEQRAAEKAKAAKGAAPKAAKKVEAKKAAPKNHMTAAKGSPKKHFSAAPQVTTSSKLHTNELDVGTKFAIVRENISTLVNATNALANGSQTVVSHPVGNIVRQLDGELQANIEVLSSLRREVFGMSDSEKEADSTQGEAIDEEVQTPAIAAPQSTAPSPSAPYPVQPSGTVPMPPPPSGFPGQ